MAVYNSHVIGTTCADGFNDNAADIIRVSGIAACIVEGPPCCITALRFQYDTVGASSSWGDWHGVQPTTGSQIQQAFQQGELIVALYGTFRSDARLSSLRVETMMGGILNTYVLGEPGSSDELKVLSGTPKAYFGSCDSTAAIASLGHVGVTPYSISPMLGPSAGGDERTDFPPQTTGAAIKRICGIFEVDVLKPDYSVRNIVLQYLYEDGTMYPPGIPAVAFAEDERLIGIDGTYDPGVNNSPRTVTFTTTKSSYSYGPVTGSQTFSFKGEIAAVRALYLSSGLSQLGVFYESDLDTNTGPNLDANRLGYFSLDGTLNDPIAGLTIQATGTPTYAPAWNGMRGVQLAANESLILPTFPNTPPPQGHSPAVSLSFWFQLGASVPMLTNLFDHAAFSIDVSDHTLSIAAPTQATVAIPYEASYGTWHHLAISLSYGDDNVMSVWLDGKRICIHNLETPAAPSTPLSGATIGSGGLPGLLVCDVAVFSCPLSDQAALFLASDCYHPDGAFSPQVEYLSIQPQGDAVSCTDGPLLEPTGNGFVIAAWASTDDIDIYEAPAWLIERISTSDPTHVAFRLGIDASARPVFEASNADGSGALQLVADYPLGDRTWAHVAAVFAKDHTSIYLNGACIATAPWGISSVGSVSQATIAIGRNWPTPIYSVSVYAGNVDPSVTEEQYVASKMAELDDPLSDQSVIVMYDFSVNPPLAHSKDPGLATPPALPPTSQIMQLSSAGYFSLGGYVNVGSDSSTLLSTNSKLGFAAWINPQATDGIRVIAARTQEEQGYSFYLAEGKLAFELLAIGNKILVESQLTIPTNTWSYVVANVDATGRSPTIDLFVNGVAAASNAYDKSSVASTSFDADVPLTIGSRFQQLYLPTSNDHLGQFGDGQTLAGDSFNGFVGRLTVCNAPIDAYGSYFEALPLANVVADIMLDQEPIDLTGRNSPLFANLAQSYTWMRPWTPTAFPTRTRAQRMARGDAMRDLMQLGMRHLDADVPEQDRWVLDNTSERAHTILVQHGALQSYLVAYDDATQPGHCFYIADSNDNPTLAWIAAFSAVVSAIFSLWGMTSNATKLADVSAKAIQESEDIRESLYAVKAVIGGSGDAVASACMALFRVLWRSGFLTKLIWCFGVSYFTLARILSWFAPYVGAALVVAQFVIAAQAIRDALRSTPDTEPPLLKTAFVQQPDETGYVPLVVNGDKVQIEVTLASPPDGAAVIDVSGGPLAVSPSSFSFTPANWMVPVTVNLSRDVPNAAGASDQVPTPVIFTGRGVANGDTKIVMQRVAKLKVDPDEVTLKDDGKGSYVADIEVSMTTAIDSDAPVTVTFDVEGDDKSVITFDPPTLTFTNQDESLGVGPIKTTRATRSKTAGGPDPVKVTASAASNPYGRAGDKSRYSFRLKIDTAEVIEVTMVDAHKGNCFIVKNVGTVNGTRVTSYSVIDGGVSGTGARISAYLLSQSATKVDYVFCSHYDDDHIQGLIELLSGAQGGLVQKVVFNPPPPGAELEIAAAQARGEYVSPKVINSVDQGRELATLAGARLIAPISAFPPPLLPLPNVPKLPTITIDWAGPSPENIANLVRNNENPQYINRASLLFLMRSGTSTFKFLQTGDGYDKGNKTDIRGPYAASAGSVLTVVQVPHHGSDNNSDAAFYAAYPAKTYLISSKYSAHYHPQRSVLAAMAAGNAAAGNRNFNVYISDANFPTSEIPPGGYTIYVGTGMVDSWATFTFDSSSGQLTPPAGKFSKVYPA